VLILRDVLGFSAREAAETLETTATAVNSALQRARKAVEERLPARSQQATLRALGDASVRAIVERYIAAWERGDVDAIAGMLAEDATFAMPPYRTWWRGREVIAAFAAAPVHRYLPTRANGQQANATYRWDAQRGCYVAEALEVLTLEGAHVKEMVAFMTPEIFPRFGLPEKLRPPLRRDGSFRPSPQRANRRSPAVPSGSDSFWAPHVRPAGGRRLVSAACQSPALGSRART
jgi:RNA polymerase sigma-70 factor (ECF subfamily)